MTDTAETSATTTTAIIYDVLFYRRVAAGKKHRDKGVSKFDGVLTVLPSSASAAMLTLTPATDNSDQDKNDNANNSSSESEDEDDELAKLSWNERRKRQMLSQKKKSNHQSKKSKTTASSSSSSRTASTSSLYAGRVTVDATAELAQDAVLVLGGYQVQIVSRRRSSSSSSNNNTSDAATATAAPRSSSIVPVRKPMTQTRTILTSKKPAASINNNNNNKLIRSTTTSSKPVGSSGSTVSSKTLPVVTHRKPVPSQQQQQQPPVATVRSALLQQSAKTTRTTTPTTTTKLVSKKRPLLASKLNAAAAVPVSNKLSRRRPLHAVKAASTLGTTSDTTTATTLTTTSKYHTSTCTATTPTCLPHIPLPAGIRNVLRPHQITGVDFLWRLLTEKGGCILGDEMGLGKTLMTIASISALHRRQREKQFVVVCPSSLVKNWAAEFDKWLGRASQPKRVVISKGGEEGLQQIKAYTSSMKRLQLKNHTGQVLIVSYDLFRRNADQFVFPEQSSVGLLVVDEGHRLKCTTGSQTLTALESLSADARLCITATPIQNNLKEFFALAHFCCPGILGDLASFRKDFERPIAAANQKNATREQLAKGLAKSKELEALAKTFMLRRLQKDVLKTMLPPRTEVLLFCRPSAQQCQLYHAITKMNARGECSGNMADALTALTALRKICSHPFLSEDGGNDNNDTAATHADPATSISLSGKLVVLDALLQQIRERCPADKVVIVSNFTSALSVIETLVLQPHNFGFSRLDGSTEMQNRQALVDSFNRASPENNFCFLLSSKAGGVGLNLVGANKLVMFDADWNPSTDLQAMGRVYRQGQTKPCTLYRLFSAGTVEEVIYQRQSQKGGLATLTVDASSSSSNCRVGKATTSKTATNNAKFSKEELKDCFTLKVNSACDTKEKVGKRWPDYTGTAGLESLGCTDEPLLVIAKSMPETLRFVHLVDDDEDANIAASTDDNDSSSSNDDKAAGEDLMEEEEESSSESENEFE